MKNILNVFILAFLLITLSPGATLAEKKGVKETTDFHPARVIMEIDLAAYSMPAETKVTLWSPKLREESFLMTIKVTSETVIRIRGEKITIAELRKLNGKEVEIWGQIEVLYEEGKEKQYSWITVNIDPVYLEKKIERKRDTI